jgi:uncharacterized glyoxalase superfamily protein PhnB
MPATPKSTKVNVIPCLRYRDAPAAIAWLCDTFGFERHLVVPGENNTIIHSQLTFGNGMIMVGSAGNANEYGKLMVQPDDIGGRQTQSLCVVVADADAAYQRATQAGATIVIDIKDEDYGGRSFTCRDIENHLWTIGTYDPFA